MLVKLLDSIWIADVRNLLNSSYGIVEKETCFKCAPDKNVRARRLEFISQ